MTITPTVRNPGTTNATNEFKGSEHKIERIKKYLYFWRCVYDLQWYPFDRQTCNMWMKMPRHYRDLLRFNPEKIEYKGNKAELTEYSVDKILFCSAANGTELVLSVTLGRPLLGSILTIYIPTLLLLLIRFESESLYACKELMLCRQNDIQAVVLVIIGIIDGFAINLRPPSIIVILCITRLLIPCKALHRFELHYHLKHVSISCFQPVRASVC